MMYENRFSLNGYYRVAGIGEIANDISKNGQWVNAVNERGETPLHIAARHKKFDLFQIMLPYFLKIEARDNQGDTIIHALLDNSIADSNKYETKCSQLIQTLIRIQGGQANKKNRNGWTPVHLAAKNCQIEVLNVLEKDYPNFSLRVENGETALHLACKNMGNLIDTPTEIEVINNLIIHGCDVNAKNNKGYSVLHYAVEWCGVRVVEKLIDCGADLDCQTNNLQLSPLHLATRKKNFIVMEALIKSGANVNSAAHAGFTPLHFAVIIGSLDVMKILMDNGANVNYGDQWTPLHLAIYLKRRDFFKVLIRNQADVNISGVDCLTPLHLASILGNYKFAKVLINRGAKVNCCDKKQYTPLNASIKDSRYPYLHRLMRNSIHTYLNDISLSKYFSLFFHVTSNRDHKMISRLLIVNGADVNVITKNNESPLYFAAENGNVKLVRILLKLGAEVDHKEKRNGFTALHAAIHGNHVDVVKELINANANLKITANDGKNPLHLAAFYNRVGVVKELINGNIDVNITTTDGETALYLATLHNYIDVIKELLNANADSNIRAKDGKSPLHLAVEKNNFKVFKLLLKRGAGMNDDDKRLRNSPLHIAAREDNEFMIEFLLKFGAKVNAVNEDGFTPLHCAVSNEKELATRMLIGFEADVNCKTKKYQLTPLHLALQHRFSSYSLIETLIRADPDVSDGDIDGVTPLHLAVLNNQFLKIIEWLIDRGADVNCTDNILQFTPLHIVVIQRNQPIFDLLMRSGAKVNVSDKNGLTPLHLASMLGSVNFAEALIHYGANVNCRDVNMYTPLHFAICNSRVMKKVSAKIYSIENSWISKSLVKPREFGGQKYKDLIELLIERGAELNALTKCGESLFYFAVEANAVTFIKILMERGFAVNCKEKRLGLTPLQTAVLNDYKEIVQLLISCGANVNVVTKNGKSLLHLAAESGGTRVLEYLLRPKSEYNDTVKRCPFSIDMHSESDIRFDVNARDYLGMTPLHIAALQSNRKQATEILLIYGASAYVQDNYGYLPIHYAIKNNSYQQLETLLAFGVDINDFKIYSKLDVDRIGYDSIVGYRMLRHIIKLKALEFPIARVYELILQEPRNSEDVFYEVCLKEIAKLKVYFVGQGVSLYNLLHIKRRGRRIHTNNLKPQIIEREFPIYYSLILNFYHDTVVKESFIKRAEFALFQLTKVDLPVVCTDKIFYYLGITSLVTLIKAAEITHESRKKSLCIQMKDSEETYCQKLFYELIYKIFNACATAKDMILTLVHAAVLFLLRIPEFVYNI